MNKVIFREKDIRPEHLLKKCEKLHKKDVNLFFNNKKDFVNINCPACGHSKYNLKFKKGIFNFCECSRCDTLFINPRPNEKQLSNFYSLGKSIDFWSQYIFPASEKVRIKNIFHPRAKLIAKLIKKYYKNKPNTILEVGAGFGSFLEIVRNLKLAKKFLIVEPSKPAVQKCKERGFEVLEDMVENVNLKKKVDIVVNFELIEHLFNPKIFIKSCNTILDKNGLLILTTPNIKGFDLMTLGKLSDNIQGPNHLNYFNPQSIKILLNKCGFNVVEISTPGRLDAEIVRNKVLSGNFNIENHDFLKHILIEKWDDLGSNFQDFLSDNLLSSHLWIVAKKL